MRVGLFIPCYVDQFYPQVGMATVDVLESLGVEIDFPEEQTCCGQPMLNTGCAPEARQLAERFLKIFRSYDYVVAPSGSCVSMVRHHFEEILPDSEELHTVASRTREFCEFLVDVLDVRSIDGAFPHRVGIHQSCHGLRELRLGPSSEVMAESFSKVHGLLSSLDGITITEQQRRDECCGFGGTFAVSEEGVSCLMGQDRLLDHRQSGTEILTAVDMSCLMHLDGLNRRGPDPVRVMHVAEVLADAMQVSRNK